MWRATWSITDHKFSDFYQCWSRASWKFQSIDTRISFISNHCFVLFFFSGLYLCTVLSQRFHSVHIFLIWRRLFEASSGVAENIVFSAFQTLFISTFSFQSIFNSEPLFSICRADINMRLVIHVLRYGIQCSKGVDFVSENEFFTKNVLSAWPALK